MDRRRIGSLQVSVVGIGCNNFGWRIDGAASAAVVDAALAAGINFFDTADIYGRGESEEYLGRALKGRRGAAVIATKFGMKAGEGNEGARPEYVKRALEVSLKRLGIDCIDLYQLHKPDPATPIADTLGALEDAVKAGKVREIGCSNFSAEQLREAGSRFASVQNEYSLLQREPEKEVLAECARLQQALLPYFPLSSGLLTGKYRVNSTFPEGSRGKDEFGPKVFTEENLAKAQALEEFAVANGHTLLELAFSWLLMRPQIASVIAGAKTPGQVKANANAAGWKLSDAAMASVDRILNHG